MIDGLKRGARGTALVLLAVAAGRAAGQPGGVAERPHAGMLRYPDVSATHICFVYANDIWIVPRTGGVASPLASPPGPETMPRFSPDGKTIAFGGNYDGGRDLYTVPVMPGVGVVPTRVTHHPAGETLSEWTPDGKLLFISNGLAGLARQSQLLVVDAAGGLPTRLPVPYGGFGSISPDGQWLAYTPHSTDNRTWKRYRGGMATDIWLFNLRDNTSRKITDWEGTDTLPMWNPSGASDVVYYLSDAGPEHRLNVWSYELKSGTRTQITTFADDDVRWPGIGPGPRAGHAGEIVFQLGSKLMLLDLGTKRSAAVEVLVPGARASLRTRSVDAARTIMNTEISPTGKRVAVEARGDIWTLPAKEGVPRNLTRTDGIAERDPSWSPDGRWIAYFSDESGEYELWLRPSDARPPEAKKADDEEKKEEKKEEEAAGGATMPASPVKLTNLGPGFRFGVTWSPDSKHLTFHDKSGALYLVGVAEPTKPEISLVDTDPWASAMRVSWSSDSGWIAYARTDDGNSNGCVWVFNVKSGEKTRLTSPMFSSNEPTFDRKGEYLYFRSNRSINAPMYADIDSTWIYTNTEQLFMVPLKADTKSPFAPKSDEEELKKEEKKEDKKDDKKDEKKNDEADKPKGGGGDEKPQGAAQADDAISGSWECKAQGVPDAGEVPFVLNLKLASDGTVTGSVVSVMGGGAISGGRFDRASGELSFQVSVGDAIATLTGTVRAGEVTGRWTVGDASGSWSGRRSGGAPAPAADGKPAAEKQSKDKTKPVKIDLDGFERRALVLPVTPGSFRNLAVTHDNKLMYVRAGARGSGAESGIKILDPFDDTREEKSVTAGGGFSMSADGKKILTGMRVLDAAAGGGKATTVPTAGMSATIRPRVEWKQLLTDVYRFNRDYFYVQNLHGVDWDRFRDHYMAMIDDCVSREDVGYVMAEFISELNVGHAYLRGLGDAEPGGPSVPVGMLGCDYELDRTPMGPAYRIAAIFEGGPWDADARGPLSQPGVNVKAGDYLLAVNGVPIDTSKDPWAAFVGTADRPTMITVSDKPALDAIGASQREVLVRPLSSETDLRYRAWIERNRAYVEKQTDGKVGYIYVPNTGTDGQSDLVRQFVGQLDRPALIIDERWNGGGQIPNRFIEMLNRPRTNYWALRDGKDWGWPQDSHQGPKCMLINGLAGSGGDMFPWLFRHAGLGKLIGMRTWGGLVGISGNPGLIDGGSISVPRFGFYDVDGTWGVEGHGVDPDIEIVDDPALMVPGSPGIGDPQLDRAIAQMFEELRTRPYIPGKRPADPDRKGMGIPEEDK